MDLTNAKTRKWGPVVTLIALILVVWVSWVSISDQDRAAEQDREQRYIEQVQQENEELKLELMREEVRKRIQAEKEKEEVDQNGEPSSPSTYVPIPVPDYSDTPLDSGDCPEGTDCNECH